MLHSALICIAKKTSQNRMEAAIVYLMKETKIKMVAEYI